MPTTKGLLVIDRSEIKFTNSNMEAFGTFIPELPDKSRISVFATVTCDSIDVLRGYKAIIPGGNVGKDSIDLIGTHPSVGVEIRIQAEVSLPYRILSEEGSRKL